MAQQRNVTTDNTWVTWGLLGFIAYILYQEWQTQQQQNNPPLPNFISPSTPCN